VPGQGTGVLRVCPENPRYFTDDGGRAIYLAGAQTWNNLVDMGASYPPHVFNFTAYLDFLQEHNHNFFRLWAWELPKFDCPRYPFRKHMSPFPWERTGPGQDVLGMLKFDLTRFHQPYFDRMRERIVASARRGIFVNVMLFEGWALQFTKDPTPHPFFERNNVNGASFGQDGKTVHSLAHPRITAVQEAYVRKVLDTVNDLDNVLYEIINEAGPYSLDWQYHMIRFVKESEAALPKRHLVGMTYQYEGGTHDALLKSDADWIAPGADVSKTYWTDPPPADGRKIVVADTDHLGGSGTGDRVWVWKSFARGLHTLFMDRYELPDSVTDKLYDKAEEIRRAMGHTVSFSRRMDLRKATPRPDLASTGFCLAQPGREYLVYLPEGKSVKVDLSGAAGALKAEWFDPSTGESLPSGQVQGGRAQVLNSPFPQDAVLYLVK